MIQSWTNVNAGMPFFRIIPRCWWFHEARKNIAKIEIDLNWEWIPKFQSTNCQFVRGILFDDLDVCLFWKTLKLEIYKWVQEWHSWLALPKGRVEEEYHSIHCWGVQKQRHSKFERGVAFNFLDIVRRFCCIIFKAGVKIGSKIKQ